MVRPSSFDYQRNQWSQYQLRRLESQASVLEACILLPDPCGARDVCCNGRSYQQQLAMFVYADRYRVCSPDSEIVVVLQQTQTRSEF